MPTLRPSAAAASFTAESRNALFIGADDDAAVQPVAKRCAIRSVESRLSHTDR